LLKEFAFWSVYARHTLLTGHCFRENSLEAVTVAMPRRIHENVTQITRGIYWPQTQYWTYY